MQETCHPHGIEVQYLHNALICSTSSNNYFFLTGTHESGAFNMIMFTAGRVSEYFYIHTRIIPFITATLLSSGLYAMKIHNLLYKLHTFFLRRILCHLKQ